MSNSNHMSISHRLAVIAMHSKFFCYLSSLGGNFGHPTPILTPGRFFSKSITSSLGQSKGSHQNWSWLVEYFLDILLTDTHTDTHTDTQTHRSIPINPTQRRWRGFNQDTFTPLLILWCWNAIMIGADFTSGLQTNFSSCIYTCIYKSLGYKFERCR